jgi:hypothetical protein
VASVPAHRIRYTWAEYLALEASSNVKHEFLDGQIYAMAGGTPEHAALAATVIGLLFPQLRDGRCRAHDADLRVRVRETGLATYPDVTVVCGKRERDPDDAQAVTNPTLVSHRERTVEVWTRAPDDTWTKSVSGDGAVARLDSIDAKLDVSELYISAAEPTRE